jgi:hypothetical protein
MKNLIKGRREITEALNMSWPSVMNLHQNQDLPLFKAGGVWLLHPDMIKDWCETQVSTLKGAIDTAPSGFSDTDNVG